MKLLVAELLTGGTLTQTITVGSKNILLKHVRPHLYKHGHPPGGVTVEVRNAAGKTIATSNEVTVATIDADISSADFFHGHVRFNLDYPLKAGTTYYFTLVANGSYAFNETAAPATGYLGWCNDYDLQRVERDYTPSIGTGAAFGLELWSRVATTKGK